MSASPSSSGSSSRSSSATPPPDILLKKKKPAAKKSAPDHGKSEGEDLTWAYAPPADAVLVNDDGADAGEFDWDAVKENDELELCLIRIPDSIKPKVLDNLKVEIPATSRSARIGTIPRKHTTFDVWAVGNDDAQPIGGEEIKSLSCLLPRKSKKGKLYPAPKPIARHLVIVAQPVNPTPATGTENEVRTTNPPRFAYPKEVLKHAYLPYGSLLRNDGTASVTEDAAMDVDEVAEEVQSPPASPKKKRSKAAKDDEAVAEGKSGKGKKRKGEAVDAESPVKKSKKSKVA
ncbi:hypothetical protein D9619_012194 [Psilocybe cf. subviscida]|uniref:DNA-directed RNA polymerase I subunit RPA34 n=1 Tax=Psilocybe cf. subviscida TaxID=2480587 RepID=A0A8H5B909_9AGAR|nr:hypothetical protein D9619_012194 [Psilocybe cf. subviscida]